jgi:translation initiation factor IF-1
MPDGNSLFSGEVIERISPHSWSVRLVDGSLLVCTLSRSYVGCRIRDPEKYVPKVGEKVFVERSPYQVDRGRIVRYPRGRVVVSPVAQPAMRETPAVSATRKERDGAGRLSGTIVSGEIVTFGPGNRVTVRLSDGGEVEAVLALRRLQSRHGCLFGSPVGWRVAVQFREPAKPARVVEIESRAT